MSVDDNWGEAIRKSTEQVTPGDKSTYNLRAKITNTALDPIPVTGDFAVTASLRHDYLNADDTTETYTYASFGTANERITLIAYTAPSVGTQTVYKTFTYVPVGGKFKLTTITWSIV